MFVISAVATDTRAVGQAAGLAIGGTIAMDALFGGPATGASMNPARSLGPAIASGHYADLWLYLTAPVIGAAIGALAYEVVRGTERSLRANEGRPQAWHRASSGRAPGPIGALPEWVARLLSPRRV